MVSYELTCSSESTYFFSEYRKDNDFIDNCFSTNIPNLFHLQKFVKKIFWRYLREKFIRSFFMVKLKKTQQEPFVCIMKGILSILFLFINVCSLNLITSVCGTSYVIFGYMKVVLWYIKFIIINKQYQSTESLHVNQINKDFRINVTGWISGNHLTTWNVKNNLILLKNYHHS